MAWDDFTRARYGAGKNVTQSMARILRDHDQDALGLPFETDASGNTTSATWATVDTINITVPTNAYGNWTLNIWPLVDGNGDIRIQDDAETANGTGVSFNVSSMDLPSVMSIDMDAAWTDTGTRDFNIQMQANAGTVTMDLGDRLCIWWSAT